MEAKITVLTLGVRDLERSVKFYREMGLLTEGIIGKEFEFGAVAFFDLQSGLRLALWPLESISRDTGLDFKGEICSAMTIGHNVDSKAAVDTVMVQARAAGAVLVKEAADTFYGGYAGYFQDPDGHLWDVVYNPAFIG